MWLFLYIILVYFFYWLWLFISILYFYWIISLNSALFMFLGIIWGGKCIRKKRKKEVKACLSRGLESPTIFFLANTIKPLFLFYFLKSYFLLKPHKILRGTSHDMQISRFGFISKGINLLISTFPKVKISVNYLLRVIFSPHNKPHKSSPWVQIWMQGFYLTWISAIG